jgi:uncharacterized protein (DUF58 family)
MGGLPMKKNLPRPDCRSKFLGPAIVGLICGVGVYFAQHEWRNQPLVLLFAAVCSVILLSFALTVFSTVWSKLAVGRHVKIQAVCGETVVRPLLPAFLARICSVHSCWEVNQGGQFLAGPEVFLRSDGKEEIVFNRRCRIHRDECPGIQVQRMVAVGDPLGLFSFRFRTDLDADILIEPGVFEAHSPSCIMSVAEAANAKASPSGSPEGDLSEMREYREGDSARLIIWKVLAKTGGQRRMVRIEERVEARRCALYLVATGPGDDRAASFIKHFLAQRNVAGDWVFGVSGSPEVFCRSKGGDTFSRVVKQISRSGLLDPEVDLMSDFKDFIDKSKRLRIENPVVVVGGEPEDSGIVKLRDQIRSHAQRCGILIVRTTGNPEFLN